MTNISQIIRQAQSVLADQSGRYDAAEFDALLAAIHRTQDPGVAMALYSKVMTLDGPAAPTTDTPRAGMDEFREWSRAGLLPRTLAGLERVNCLIELVALDVRLEKEI